MSRIHFHSIDGEEAEVRGSERAWLSGFCNDLMLVALKRSMRDERGKPSVWRDVLRDTYVAREPVSEYDLGDPPSRFRCTLATWLRVTDKNFIVGEVVLNPFSLALNTTLATGSDPAKLGARLHGQCELHAYVEGKNRSWLAEIIRRGLGMFFFREDAGWEAVVDLLELNADTAIVTSYSVTERFPNRWIAGWESEDDDGDSWYDVAYEEQWKLAIAGLRKSERGLEMMPDDWDDFHFENGINAFELNKTLLDMQRVRSSERNAET